jgi:hypothetical protein
MGCQRPSADRKYNFKSIAYGGDAPPLFAPKVMRAALRCAIFCSRSRNTSSCWSIASERAGSEPATEGTDRPYFALKMKRRTA